MLRQWLVEFAQDSKVHIALLLVMADLILGVAAAFRLGTFRLSYVGDLLKNDVLGKLLPYLGMYILALVQGNESIVIPGLDFGFLAGSAYVLLVAALTGSILSSVRALGLTALPESIAGPENTPVVVEPVPAPPPTP